MLTTKVPPALPTYALALKLLSQTTEPPPQWQDLGFGERNRVWRLRVGSKDLVLRIPKAQPRGTGCYSAEYYNHNCAHQIGLAPKVWVEDVRIGLLITDYLSGPCVKRDDFKAAEFCRALSHALRKLHDSGYWFLYRNDLLEVVQERLTNYLNTDLVMLPGELFKISQAADKCRRILVQLPRDLCPVHGDLALKNIMCTPEGIRFIDWEAAGMGDRMNELAFLLFSIRRSPALAHIFLSHYFADTAYADSRLCTAKVFLYWLLHVYRWATEHVIAAKNTAKVQAGLVLRDKRIQEFQNLLGSEVIREAVRGLTVLRV
jgi:aminoglycoside phosphotransferase